MRINSSGYPRRGLSGLGIDPVTAATAGQKAIEFIAKVEDFLNIGPGRREADMIVPFQNDVGNLVLAPVSAALDSGIEYSHDEWVQMYNALVTTEAAWLKFLRNTEWDDGRAAVQAEATLAPYFAEFKPELLAHIEATGGIFAWLQTDVGGVTVPIVSGPGGAGVDPVYTTQGTTQSAGMSAMAMLAIGGVALYFLMGKKAHA
jgi:hypothetical protein